MLRYQSESTASESVAACYQSVSADRRTTGMQSAAPTEHREMVSVHRATGCSQQGCLRQLTELATHSTVTTEESDRKFLSWKRLTRRGWAKHIVTIDSVEPRRSVSLRRWKLRLSERLAYVRFCQTFSPDVLNRQKFYPRRPLESSLTLHIRAVRFWSTHRRKP